MPLNSKTWKTEHSERQSELRALPMSSSSNEHFERIAWLAARICEVPIGLVTILETDRQDFKASYGTDLDGTSLEQAICVHTIAKGGLLEIHDTLEDDRTKNNAICTGAPFVRFYAGTPIHSPAGVALGSLCVLGHEPHTLTEMQREALVALGREVDAQIQLLSAMDAQRILTSEIDHRVKNSLQMVGAFLRMQARRVKGQEAKAALEQAERRVGSISLLHDQLHLSASYNRVDLKAFIHRVARLTEGQLPYRVSLSVELDSFELFAGRASGVAMLVNEFVTNSVKHAFPDGKGGTIRLHGRYEGSDYVLDLGDDGVGIPDGAAKSSGLGISIMEASAGQAGGVLTRIPSEHGVQFRLTLPAREDGDGA
ncbi:histidine kinase dimerization/phosphoacceptor domain -containing protein [Tropicimonas sp. IMCC34011]|uniref:histidine kinase dimerization/phosphoacceptor domain -containing protein n=1 Tax=Tropicimonas sp. IMCC34011 TaxID=2248759 RepID=UPI000E241FAF|nr:histidine kinase dimerization/phosphoacceptor domain -containing protein [Tropicimonas sp. IMCC34011]